MVYELVVQGKLFRYYRKFYISIKKCLMQIYIVNMIPIVTEIV
jgi:hypothetical protein